MSAFDIVKSVLIWVVLLILLPIPLLILFLYKITITLIAKLRHPDLIPFNTNDTMASSDFVYTKPLLNIGMIIKMDGHLNLDEFRATFQQKLLDPKELNGQPRNVNLYCYVDRFAGYNFKRAVDQIKIEEHVVEGELERKPDQDEVEALSAFICKFFYSPHTRGKPLWKISVVKMADGSTILFFCIHHAMADGYSLIYLFDELTGSKSPNLSKPFNETLLERVKIIAGGPATMQNFLTAVSSAPNPLSTSGIDTKHHYALITLDLRKVKTVRKRTGDGTTHVLAILFTILGGVFRTLLVQQGKCKSEDDLPDYIFLASSLGWPSHPRDRMCNEWAPGSFRVPIKNANPMERLMDTEKYHNEFFANNVHKITRRMFVPLTAILPACVGEAMATNADIPMSASWSPIAAGQDYQLLGHTVNNIFPFVGHTHPKMTWVTISLSHSNKIDVTVAVNHEFMDNCVDFNRVTNQLLNKELDKLVELCSTEAK